MRATRIVLFATLAAVIAASVALAVENNATRGPASSFELVPTQAATSSELISDAAAIVRRLQSLGYKDTQARANTSSIEVTMYGSAPKLRAALEAALAAADIEVRPVVCAAPLFAGGGHAGQQPGPALAAPRLTCGSKYLLTAGALRIDTTTGQPARNVGPDPVLAYVASTSRPGDVPSRTVLLATGQASGFSGERLLAGPADVVNADIASASTTFVASEWIVDLALTTSGAKKYNALTKSQFHAYVAVDIDGTVISAPLIEPSESSFGSLGAKMQIEAGLTMNQAVDLADDLTSPLVVPLELAR